MTTKELKTAIREPFAWPGGYEIAIILSDGMPICHNCAKNNFRTILHETKYPYWNNTGWKAVGSEILWEGENHCVQCSRNLSVYGEEEED